MALIECKNCGNLISDKAESCPRCNHKKELNNYHRKEKNYDNSINETNSFEIEEPTESKTKCWLMFLLGTIVFLLCIFLLLTGAEFRYKMLWGIIGGPILIAKYGRILFFSDN